MTDQLLKSWHDFRFHSLCNAFSTVKMVIKLGSFTAESNSFIVV